MGIKNRIMVFRMKHSAESDKDNLEVKIEGKFDSFLGHLACKVLGHYPVMVEDTNGEEQQIHCLSCWKRLSGKDD